jgi:gliding motility-associated lipoprotein GldD
MMKVSLKIISTVFLFAAFLLLSCSRDYTPKPRGYYRIDMPERRYVEFDSCYPFHFQYPVYSRIDSHSEAVADHPYWFNLDFPAYHGTIHFSYFSLQEHQLKNLINDSHEFVSKHMSKATAITHDVVMDRQAAVYGLIFHIRGSGAASPYQFYLTDSSQHFLRGALYFRNVPNNDSLAPVIERITGDALHLIQTFQWKPSEQNNLQRPGLFGCL